MDTYGDMVADVTHGRVAVSTSAYRRGVGIPATLDLGLWSLPVILKQPPGPSCETRPRWPAILSAYLAEILRKPSISCAEKMAEKT